MTAPTAQHRRVDPGVTVRKVFIVGVYFLGLAVLAGSFTPFLSRGVPATSGLDLLLVAQQLTSIFIATGVGMLLIGLVLWLLPGNAAAANVINQYYAALENRDYTAAFQYLDSNMRTSEGTLITPSWFREEAETNDSRYGEVVHYGLARVKADFGKRIYTLHVTRSQASVRIRPRLCLEKQGHFWKIVRRMIYIQESYRTQLRVKKQGDAWEIVSFDRF